MKLIMSKMGRKKIIINADDFGINSVVTKAIEDMIAKGIVTSTTIMANGACLDDVKRVYDKYPDVSYGIHLCIAEFDSITKSEILHQYGLTDGNGVFIKKELWNLKSFPDDLKHALYEELCAQIELVQSYGICLSHADSHQLVHTTFIELQDIFIKALKKYKIEKVRIGEEVRPIRILFNNVKRIVRSENNVGMQTVNDNSKSHGDSLGILNRLKGLILAWRKSLIITKSYRSSFKTVDYFYSVHDFFHSHPRNGNYNYELMCHPGHPALEYTTEIDELLTSSIFRDSSIQLISYKAL